MIALLSGCGGGDPNCELKRYDGPSQTAYDLAACLRAQADFFECSEPEKGPPTRCGADEDWGAGSWACADSP